MKKKRLPLPGIDENSFLTQPALEGGGMTAIGTFVSGLMFFLLLLVIEMTPSQEPPPLYIALGLAAMCFFPFAWALFSWICYGRKVKRARKERALKERRSLVWEILPETIHWREGDRIDTGGQVAPHPLVLCGLKKGGEVLLGDPEERISSGEEQRHIRNLHHLDASKVKNQSLAQRRRRDWFEEKERFFKEEGVLQTLKEVSEEQVSEKSAARGAART